MKEDQIVCTCQTFGQQVRPVEVVSYDAGPYIYITLYYTTCILVFRAIWHRFWAARVLVACGFSSDYTWKLCELNIRCRVKVDSSVTMHCYVISHRLVVLYLS
ncbi:hypothetical protein AVEN_16941-1 [Araneus ventricosus]|uniref:Uncharacterized protein n=1 Tax=Araneus ventricosus TaxID=182803 RepID=A0A4Y2D4I7_ARAVE|nr:hypothetical protein AVEN_16941-1 [Araneus ventricosus]